MCDDKISVIIPVHNTRDYLKQCLDSVLGQTYTNMEIILVNDGSTDGSGELCEAYAKKDKRIKVCHKNKSGVGGGRNTGLDHAEGAFLSFVDSDDTIAPDYLETMMKAQQKTGADIVCTGYSKVWTEENRREEVVFSEKEYQGCAEALLALGKGTLDVVAWGKLYKCAIFQELRFPENQIHEDVLTTHRALCHAEKVIQLPGGGYYYRQRSGSVMNGETTAETHFEAYIKRYEDICRIVREGKLPDKVRQVFFRSAADVCYEFAYREFWKIPEKSVRGLRTYWRTNCREIHKLEGFRRKSYFPYTVAVLSWLMGERRK